MEEMKTSLVRLLLRPEVPNVMEQLPNTTVKVKRLSELLGCDVLFSLRSLPYGKVRTINESASKEKNIDILLSGCVDPDFKDPALREKFGGATPAETVKAMLLPGEIEDLSRTVERLSGYRMATIEEVKNG